MPPQNIINQCKATKQHETTRANKTTKRPCKVPKDQKRRNAIRGIQWKRQIVETYGKIAGDAVYPKSIGTL